MAELMAHLAPDDQGFEVQAAFVLTRLRTSLSELIGELPDASGIRKAADLQRLLQLGGTPAWQIFTVASASDPLSVGSHVPGAAPMKRLLKIAAKRGVSADVLRKTASAFEDFQQLVVIHAGDRKSFNTMMRSIASGDRNFIDIEHRRAAYRANGHIWGVRARSMLSCCIFHTGHSPDRVDLVTVRGLIDIRWLRSQQAPLLISRVRPVDGSGRYHEDYTSEPLDADGHQEYGIDTIRQFCSKPFPRVRTSKLPDGTLVTDLLSNGLGNTSAVTCLIGQVVGNALPRFREEGDTHNVVRTGIRTPCEAFVGDMLIHDGLFGSVSHEAFVSTGFPESGIDNDSESTRLPVQVTVSSLGRGVERLHTHDVPRYVEMAQYAIDRMGWDATRFHVYRCRVEYPILGTTIVRRFPLEEEED